MPAPRVGGIKRSCASDVCLTYICLSRTSGLSQAQR